MYAICAYINTFDRPSNRSCRDRPLPLVSPWDASDRRERVGDVPERSQCWSERCTERDSVRGARPVQSRRWRVRPSVRIAVAAALTSGRDAIGQRVVLLRASV